MEKFLIITANNIPSALWTMKHSTRHIQVGTKKFIDGLQYTLLKSYPYLASLSESGGYTNRFKFVAFEGKKQLVKWAYYCDIDGAFRFNVEQNPEIVKETPNLPDWLKRKQKTTL